LEACTSLFWRRMQLGRNGPPRHASWVDSQQSLYAWSGWLLKKAWIVIPSDESTSCRRESNSNSTEYGMGGNEGPRVEINATCFPCRYVNSDGPVLYCSHPQAAGKSGSPADDRGKYIGTLNWRTPMWCPLLLETATSLLKSP